MSQFPSNNPHRRQPRLNSDCAGAVSRTKMRALGICLCVAVVQLVSSASLFAQAGYTDREYQIKAAFLYKFARYSKWPTATQNVNQGRAKNPFVIGVVGQNPFGTILDQIASERQIDGRTISVQIIQKADDARACHLIFVPRNQDSELVQGVLEQTANRPVLLVGESNGFTQQGGVIRFFIENNRMRFEINVNSADRRKLKLSSKLLQIGKITDS